MNDLEQEHVEAALDRVGTKLGRPVTIEAVTASTNDDARRAAQAGAPHGALFLADAQTRGRGRGGHAWHSPRGENLYMSIVLRPRVELSALPTLALVLGLCVARAVDEAFAAEGMRAGIKWPNDVIVDGRKIAGLLVESSLRGGALEAVVAGVGLNVRTTSFPEEIADRATSLAVLGAHEQDRAMVAARVLAALEAALPAFEASGLASFLAELERRDVLRGVPIEVGEVRGTAAGVDEDGYLRIRGEDGELHRVAAGSVVAHGELGRPR
ncbi:biotin--[acetyl-CoA-carboxylase] ligase [Polyangium aurulentum]|uniref:biotin--[acetyl-CoA-carboxylase] ligase n=1 Tax=Polyangium aurulentum TaxID=2567896 RepID=UPI0010ADF867|nr:biotin--[acetyl-CoA-carboxylase] ligase [Polyangium aurulentum]UQA58196.1 biotin--[acetyl-CoA-carboxylase] ligase [Polyangium aurulentum]